MFKGFTASASSYFARFAPPGEEIDCVEAARIQGQPVAIGLSTRAFYIRHADRTVIRLPRCDVSYLTVKDSGACVRSQDGLALFLDTPRPRIDFWQTLAERLLAMPAMRAEYPTANGAIAFVYHPWRPHTLASWNMETNGTVTNDEAVALRTFAESELFAAMEGRPTLTETSSVASQTSMATRVHAWAAHQHLPLNENVAVYGEADEIDQAWRGNPIVLVADNDSIYRLSFAHDYIDADETPLFTRHTYSQLAAVDADKIAKGGQETFALRLYICPIQYVDAAYEVAIAADGAGELLLAFKDAEVGQAIHRKLLFGAQMQSPLYRSRPL